MSGREYIVCIERVESMIHGIAKSIWGGPYVEWEVLENVRSARDTVENNEK
jgi:hypothetical protein